MFSFLKLLLSEEMDSKVHTAILCRDLRASPGAAVKLCLGDLLVMGSNPETASLHMQG